MMYKPLSLLSEFSQDFVTFHVSENTDDIHLMIHSKNDLTAPVRRFTVTFAFHHS